QPGDILYVLPGTYVQDVFINQSGAPGKPIIMSCAPVADGGGLGSVTFVIPKDAALNGRPDIGQPADTSVVAINNSNYVWINGLNLEGVLGQSWAPSTEDQGDPNGIMWENGPCTGGRATNNVIFNNLHCGLKDQMQSTYGLLLQGNIIFHNGN